ncbi:MAG: addiction module toxin, HicA family [Peptococcaceae bacterium]|nr:addiction module toxin, HicA family [Peptococcaceae bacterium]
MKRKELIRLFENNGWWIKREGHDHTIYTNGIVNEPIPRHNEINDILAKKIIKRRELK